MKTNTIIGNLQAIVVAAIDALPAAAPATSFGTLAHVLRVLDNVRAPDYAAAVAAAVASLDSILPEVAAALRAEIAAEIDVAAAMIRFEDRRSQRAAAAFREGLPSKWRNGRRSRTLRSLQDAAESGIDVGARQTAQQDAAAVASILRSVGSVAV